MTLRHRLQDLAWALLHPVRTWGPRCSAPPPPLLIDATECVIYRGHQQDKARPSADWHADGHGFIWNRDRWQWMGPVIDLGRDGASLYPPTPPGGRVVEFRETL